MTHGIGGRPLRPPERFILKPIFPSPEPKKAEINGDVITLLYKDDTVYLFEDGISTIMVSRLAVEKGYETIGVIEWVDCCAIGFPTVKRSSVRGKVILQAIELMEE